MKKFTTTEIVNLLNQVYRGEISFSQMVEVINERVNEIDEPQYKNGDFVVNEFDSILILKEADGDRIFDHAYLPAYGELFINKVASYDGIKRHATEEEKQKLLDALAKKGKRWNAEKLCVEDISDELKDGDFVVGIGCIFILHKQIDEDSAQYHVLYANTTNGMLLYDKTYSKLGGKNKLRLATEEEKQELLDALEKAG
jgi:hypothetical protein